MSARVRVAKMSGAGNDFLVLQAGWAGPVENLVAWTRRACRRGLSVGADGVLVVEPIGVDRLRVVFRNPDGGEAFCGNGTRCAARFAFLHGLAGRSMVLETAAGAVEAQVTADDRVRLHLPPPRDLGPVSVEAAGESLAGRHVLAGVPHFVVPVAVPERAPLERWGPMARAHPAFGPGGVNFDLASAAEDGVLRLRTWERGVEAETLACGSGAVAAAHAARLAGAPSEIRVLPASGIPIEIFLPGDPASPREAVMLGDARMIFDAQLDPEATRGFPERDS